MSEKLSKTEKSRMSLHQAVVEEKIRLVFAEMDKLVSDTYGVQISGSELPITFGFAQGTLAYYSYHPSFGSQRSDLGSEHFHFSLRYFAEEGDLFLDPKNFRHVVIHEYAHYMVRHIFPEAARRELSHGQTWRKCCRKLGIVPKATFSEKQRHYEWVQLFIMTGEFEPAPLAVSKYACGDYIQHPTLGLGKIIEIEPSKTAVNLVVCFDQCIKRIDQKWALKHCTD